MESYEKEYHTKKHNYLINSEEYYNVRAKLAILKYFKGIPKNSKILEFGCGMGQNIFHLKNAIGYDISKFALNFCKKKGITVQKDLKKLKDNSFDVVFSCHVLEHLENPQQALKIMHKKLKKHGKLILILPIEQKKSSNLQLDPNEHLYCWTFRTINNLLIKSGFKPIENSILRGEGYKKLLPINRFNFTLYNNLTKLVSLIVGSKEMKIIAIKK